MCKLVLDQESSLKVLAVGHKVLFEGRVAVIEGIRVWHDLDTLIQEHRAEPVFDLALGWGGRVVNAHLRDISLCSGDEVAPSIPTPKLVVERRT